MKTLFLSGQNKKLKEHHAIKYVYIYIQTPVIMSIVATQYIIPPSPMYNQVKKEISKKRYAFEG